MITTIGELLAELTKFRPSDHITVMTEEPESDTGPTFTSQLDLVGVFKHPVESELIVILVEE